MALLAEWVNRWEGTYTLRIVIAFLQILGDLLPYLLISVMISATLNYGAARIKFVFKPVGETLAIFSAALLGLISPLPTYLALPFGVSLQPFGLPPSAVFAFVIASPL
ncbi:MAG TPA: hypothetical protein VEC37_18675, partial [Bacillota bacterium]|nr:hypothetical protein [Bacillota bacterium]